MDVHVPEAITSQLRLRGVDVLTAIEDDAATLKDEELLERARILGRVLFTQDIRLLSLGRRLAASGKTLCWFSVWASTEGNYRTICTGFRVDCYGIIRVRMVRYS